MVQKYYIVILVLSSLCFLEWRNERHYYHWYPKHFPFSKGGHSTIPHNLPLQIDSAEIYPSTFNMIMHTRISYWGKNDHYYIGHFHPLENPPIFLIYPYKLIMLTFINPPLIGLCQLGSHIAVKIIILILVTFTPFLRADSHL